MKSRKTCLGRFIMQDMMFHVYYDPDSRDGDGHFGWFRDGFVRVTVGGRDKSWNQVYACALHELMEISFRLSKAAYAPDFNLLRREDSGRYLFVASHDQFTEIVDHVADAMVFLGPELRKAWRKGRTGRGHA